MATNRAPSLSIAPRTDPRYGEAALRQDLLSHLSIALDGVLSRGVVVQRPSRPVVAVLYGLCDAASIPQPERVLAADLRDVADEVLVELRLRLADAGLSRLRLSGALGARLGLRGIESGP